MSEITAEQARGAVEDYDRDLTAVQLAEIFEKVRQRSSDGYDYAGFHGVIAAGTRRELKRLGFGVNQRNVNRSTAGYFISWKAPTVEASSDGSMGISYAIKLKSALREIETARMAGAFPVDINFGDVIMYAPLAVWISAQLLERGYLLDLIGYACERLAPSTESKPFQPIRIHAIRVMGVRDE